MDEGLCVYVGSGMMWGSLFIMFERRNEKWCNVWKSNYYWWKIVVLKLIFFIFKLMCVINKSLCFKNSGSFLWKIEIIWVKECI